jgi:Glycosyl hydrolase family 26
MRRTIATIIVAVISCTALAACSFREEESDDFRGFLRSSSSSATPIYWGATIGDQFTGVAAPWDMRPVQRLESMLGKRFSLIGFSQPFADCTGPRCVFIGFPLTPLENVRRHGSIPFFSWGSQRTPSSLEQPGFQLRDVIDGKFDGLIREFAVKTRDWGHPMFLRFNWEMNGDWFPWSEGVNGNKPGEYVLAWRHVHDLFRSVGADNVTWVWCPNSTHREGIRGQYPGDAYVDWTCLDGFNWGESNSQGWLSFGGIFRRGYQILREISPDKPTILGEVASTNLGGNKAAWISNMLDRIPPGIRGFLWFNVHDRGTNWPLEVGPNPARAFREGIRDPRFVTNRYGGLEASPIRPPAGR